MLRIYNTLTRQKEEFQPIQAGLVRMYVCGPVVYDRPHVGQAITALVFDIIRRYLEYRGYNVRYVMSFTDLHDKTISRSILEHEDPCQLAETYIRLYQQYMLELNVLPATVYPRASHTIPQVIEIIHTLLKRGYAYKVKGSVYFKIKKFKEYGKLSRQNLADMQYAEELEAINYKKDPLDLSLWVGTKNGSDGTSWDSPWGKGFPNWDVACLAMTQHYLGDQIDIHGGSNQLTFPHHENKICQSECLTRGPLARYWLHNGRVQDDNSCSTLVSIENFLAEHDRDTLRMIVLQGKYRSPICFNDEVIIQAEHGLESLRSAMRPAYPCAAGTSPDESALLCQQAEKSREAFLAAMDDDFNTSEALASLFELDHAINRARDADAQDEQLQMAQTVLRELSGVLGLHLSGSKIASSADAFVAMLIDVRDELRRQKQWQLSDQIRDQLTKNGIAIDDAKEGSSWHWE